MVTDYYEIVYDMILRRFKEAQNLVAEHYEGNFDMIFHFLVAQNLVVDRITMKEDRLTGLALMAMNKK